MSEASLRQAGNFVDYTPAVALSAGQVLQLGDGRAAVATDAIAAGAQGAVQVFGTFKVAKAADIALLYGCEAWWDHSANVVTYKKVNDRDFYLGRVQADAVAAATTVEVAFNVRPRYDVDALRDGYLSVPTGTQAVGGFGFPKILGGAASLELTATSEAQCIDLLSTDKFSKDANAIIEAVFRPADAGSGAAVDFNIGIADGTSTTDADAIGTSVFAHIDGGSLNVLAESDDAVTEVAATDTTADIVAGSAVANRTTVWFDTRNPADVQIYVNAVLVLPDAVFTIAATANPLGLIAHLEKTTGATTGRFVIDALRAWFAEQ